MCGIFGVITGGDPAFSPRYLAYTVNHLFKLSESRGKEASGCAVLSGDTIRVYKDAVPASQLIRSRQYKDLLKRAIQNNGSSPGNYVNRGRLAIIGHSRLVTDGSRESHENNQPVIVDGTVGIHNGIVVNTRELWRQFPSLKRRYDVDTEIILSLIRKFYHERGELVDAVKRAFGFIRGAASVAVMFNDSNHIVLATNNGSLYGCVDDAGSVFIFASEKYILEMLTKRRSLKNALGDYDIFHVGAGSGYLLNIVDLRLDKFSLFEKEPRERNFLFEREIPHRNIIDVLAGNRQDAAYRKKRAVDLRVWLPKIVDRFPHDETGPSSMRRCTKCILPETMPFIEFDDNGVCNYCRNYRLQKVRGKEALEEVAAGYRSKSGEPDCIVGMSGGRDSTYGLHYIKTVLNMHPIAYTYDWGMVTDLARRNISRICGKLGIEHILVSADIPKKRRYIHKNVSAWLKRPELGMIPLFMAGDKMYFYYAQQLKHQTGVELVFLCENMLERTDFKSGFAGVHPHPDPDYVYTLPIADKIRLAAYYGKQYLLNPSYINASIWDTIFAYGCFYMLSRNYHNLYRYIMWDEKTIVSTLINEYDWELATDTKSTWRIGDGTASFYNYIYYTISGFSEIDTLRSNQIREGLLSRERALALSREENKPRFESMRWYCDIIDINFEEALKVINSTPKLYGADKG